MTQRRPSNRTWHYPFRGKVITICANRAGNGVREVLFDGAEVGVIERAYFTPSMTTWSIGAPYGDEVEQYDTMKDAAKELVRRATEPPVVVVALDEVAALS